MAVSGEGASSETSLEHYRPRLPGIRTVKQAAWLFGRTFSKWREDNASQYGAAMAYYAFFSLAPLLILAIALAGAFFGAEAAEGRMVAELERILGRDGAEVIQTLVRRARGSDAGVPASIAGILALFLGGTQVFNSLQVALNVMWGVSERNDVRKGLKWDLLGYAKKRAISFGMVLVIGLLLTLSLLASAAITAFGAYLERVGRSSAGVWLLHFGEMAISFASMTLLLAAVYRLLPDVRIAWKDVWFGASVTSIFLTGGKVLIAWYLGTSSISSVYGAAGSLVVLLVWVYYSAQILLFGAEMTRVYACEFGSWRKVASNPRC
jgi:membrane protein